MALQRLTKKWLKSVKLRIRERIILAHELDDDRLRAFMESCLGVKLEGTREELLKKASLWALEESIPDNMTW